MNIQTDRALVAAEAPAVRYCTVTITAPKPARTADRPARPAARVAIVLDRSGSMAGSKLAMARNAVDHAMRLLGDRDQLAVVCYDDQVDVLLASAPASGEAKTMAQSRLRAIDARGSTDMAAGWRAAAEQVGACPRTPSGGTGPVQRSKEETDDAAEQIGACPRMPSGGTDTVPSRAEETDDAGASQVRSGGDPAVDAAAPNPARVMLLTDGLANVGETNPDVLSGVAAKLKADGIVTSTFGVGADFDDALLSRIATSGGGHFYFIEHAKQIPDILTSELGDALNIVARDAEFIIRDSIGAKSMCLNDFPTDMDEDGLHIRLGDLSEGQEVTLVLATEIGPKTLGASTSILLRLADRERVLYGAPMDVSWASVDADASRTQPVNRDVIIAAAMLLAERARAEALELNRAGMFDRAELILAKAIARIRALGDDLREIQAIANSLEDVAPRYALAMEPMLAKQQFFQSYTINRSRAGDGKGRTSRRAPGATPTGS